MNRFFGSNQNQRSGRPPPAGNGTFDLSPLNRALTPPAWAQAFQQSESNQSISKGSNNREVESFRRAFEGPQNLNNGGGEWQGQFESSRNLQSNSNINKMGAERNGQRSRDSSGGFQYRNPVAQARLYGTGFMGNGMEMGRGEIREGPAVERYDQAFVTAAQGKSSSHQRWSVETDSF